MAPMLLHSLNQEFNYLI